MGWKNNYEPDYDFDKNSLKRGEFEAVVTRAEETVSKNDNDMIKVEVTVCGIRFYWYLVAGDYFNQNLTKFCICFGIRPGDFNYRGWEGKRGRVFLDKKRDSEYYEIKYLLVPERNVPADGAQNAPPREPPRQAPPQETRRDKEASLCPRFDDDIPF
jgi:hypothetical protein